MAFVAIRRKNLVQHKQWMVRSYVVTFAFVSFRLASDLLEAGHILPDHERSAVLARVAPDPIPIPFIAGSPR